ncbi:MAG TPA: flagellar basal body rod protein FlgC [Pirellulaceae bacterium]|nr:flagellar basal body rod protein FlgC [Pirellulaceae bacterium]
MITAMDISTSALVAQRTRLDAIASNMANMSTTRNEKGEVKPYQARFVVFQEDQNLKMASGATGVKIASVETETIEPNYKYQPGHPMAIQEGDRKGYVAYPNINMTREFVDAMEASRAYEANIGVMEVTKNLGQQTLRIIG